ncbi:hypothetical protein TBK1r_47590 [Stieleria magnilauensis]|uniref:Uncharacterized protein n=1 Tax=Stieleria magnilauensis TaxID=2527963 RepID=A0ABX5XUN9_9BACT|nr:hypothetical protein TBK1r_47590 [Planctomycetes bacterium TBK1r]
MTTACKLLTVAAMLLHSIFGCSLHHACACESHGHGAHQHVAEVEDVNACDHDHASHHHDDGCHDDHQDADDGQDAAESLVRIGCDCCEKTPCEHGDSPCCSVVQCSFIPVSDVEFSLDVGPVLFVLVDIDSSFKESLRARKLVDIGTFHSGVDDPLSRCALHCSWQI